MARSSFSSREESRCRKGVCAISSSGRSNQKSCVFKIENGEYIDTSRCVWYATLDEFSSDCEKVGDGEMCTIRISGSRSVFAVYEGETNIISNYINISPKFIAPNVLYIIGGVGAGIIVFVIVLVVISRKRYKNYF